MTNFLPEEYKMPQAESRYLKFVKGDNIFRIMSSPIVGWIDWADKTPHRFRINNKPAFSLDPKGKIKHFWAMIVWNYATKQIEILEITQSGIQKAIKNLADDKDWGSPLNYDIRVTREGDGLETEYSINPKPHTKLSDEVTNAFMETPVNLEALYESENPFEVPASNEIDISKISLN
jgi:hypothetical protein